ncbi:NACHT domain-containing protein [Thalassobaculum litoreum]|uniref:Uncharacterized protein n=1 Tax=Thalassobaculum litoreum DSM 18839 TaxID=1123362 RepID=A0A8G2BPP2_9PROT|nr:hypothetical protein [Thalassobaculum litoreum]SDG59109.1 hypothetical protein SAMN05660686_04957 [Thalassobaculum litoreum DSM 18839]
MSNNIDGFIQLHRTFRDLAISEEEGEEADLFRLMRRDKLTQWSDLLQEPRVVLLSEAGSGKTEEIRHVCRELRLGGKRAFFLRIEHLVQDFEASFEEGTLEEFDAWKASGEDGWVLLDSVDEARLKDPKDFERAIRKVGRKLGDVRQRTHVVITGRTDAWRPMTDLLICETQLPWTQPVNAPEEEQESDEAVTTTEGPGSKRRKSPFRIVALDDLAGEQVDRFASAKGIVDIEGFKKALERAEAWSFTARPLDLAESVEFWLANNRIGSRLELMRASINKRLEERDQDRADANPISKKRIREGARLVAAAATLAKESAIRVPDGHQNDRGLAVKEVLPDWNDADCQTLLTRPIFDEGIYGTVRFHHRSVREFLTAEWLNEMLANDAARAKIENLFFRRQYGVEVVVPTMRPILPWLALLDQRILDRIIRLAPEVLFEGGDPAQLPVDTRAQILRETCEQLSQPMDGRRATEYSAVQRFTNPDLADVVRGLLDKHSDDEDIVWFLLRMVQQGGISALGDKARHFALTSRAKYTRIAAIRAVIEVGSPDDAGDVRKAFIAEVPPLRRSWLGELLDKLGQTQADVDWLFTALALTAPKERFEVDPLSDSLASYVAALPPALLSKFLTGVAELLGRSPHVERRHCEISERYSWLGQTAGQVLMRMIGHRDPATLQKTALTVLRTLPIAEDYGRALFDEIRSELPHMVREWSELNRALFWHCVAEERAWRKRAKEQRLTDCWMVSSSSSYWAFDVSDFDYMRSQIIAQSFLDDQLVALTLSFELYQKSGRLRARREALKKAASTDPDLEAGLKKLVDSFRQGSAASRRRQAAWRKRTEREAAKKTADKENAKQILKGRLATIRDFGNPGKVSTDQWYLHQRMSNDERQHNRWTDGHWQSLVAEFGDDVALAFRDGAIQFWRQNPPILRSEGAAANTTPVSTIFGLTGLSIEAREITEWPYALTHTEAEIATRYALQELNGFPIWLPQLEKAFPSQVLDILLKEIEHELSTETAEGASQYALYDVSWHGDWVWEQIAPSLLPKIRAKRANVRNLGYLLAIINRSSIDDKTIAAIASRKAIAFRTITFSAIWFAAWVGVDPVAAIPALAARFAGMIDPAEQTELALSFIVALVGSRSQEGRSRQAFRTVEHMKSLYLLMARYIRQQDDIERAGQGVYSPELRDDAQDARNALIAFIRETSGKEAFLALLEIGRAHPHESSRPWMSYHAKTKAAADADVEAWSPSQVQEFGKVLMVTPANHRELWYHAIDKLDTLKQDIENGDSSIASILQAVDQETEFRKFIGGWCRDRAAGRYIVSQEEELSDAKRPDLRFFGVGFDAPVPTELKLADKWTGPHLFERLEMQLCGDYLRDVRSNRGIFLFVYLGEKSYWDLPNGRRAETFEMLIEELQRYWTLISNDYAGVEDIRVIGIDVTRRGIDTKTVKALRKAKKAIEPAVNLPKFQSGKLKTAASRPRAAEVKSSPSTKEVRKDLKRGKKRKQP